MSKLVNKKKIAFLTGTRADFGKIKSLIEIVETSDEYEAYVFVTGMHLQKEYGYTVLEIERCNFTNIYKFENHTDEKTMDLTLARTVEGFSKYVNSIIPDMIIVHGDRVEALAGAIVGALNNILVTHIEGGEVSGTIDELIRHATSKMSHIHLVSNSEAKERLLKMGELDNSIFEIGSPDLDIMFSNSLPDLDKVRKYYEINFNHYAILMFHPVTTDYKNMKQNTSELVEAIIKSNKNYVVIYPNNDLGSKLILEEYKKFENNKRFKVFPSLRFEYFLTLLKNADFTIGNSSVGIREAPYYGIPVINVGDRQKNRSNNEYINNVGYNISEILEVINNIERCSKILADSPFGTGNSKELFSDILSKNETWELSKQKQFKDNF